MMLVALLFKRSNPIFWGVIAILLFIMFMGFLVLMASISAPHWMDADNSDLILAVVAGIVAAGASTTAMIVQKKQRSNWQKYGKGRSHRRPRRRDDSRIVPIDDADDPAAGNQDAPSLRELARAFSADQNGDPAAAPANEAPAVPLQDAGPRAPSPAAAAVAPSPGATPPEAPAQAQRLEVPASETVPAAPDPDVPPASTRPVPPEPAPTPTPAPNPAEARDAGLPRPGAKLTLKAPAKDWMLKAEEASEAMQGVDMREAKNLSEDDIRTLRELQETVGDLLRMSSALKS